MHGLLRIHFCDSSHALLSMYFLPDVQIRKTTIDCLHFHQGPPSGHSWLSYPFPLSVGGRRIGVSACHWQRRELGSTVTDYMVNPGDLFKIRNGGLRAHGGIDTVLDLKLPICC